jgi:diguanylate cyclase
VSQTTVSQSTMSQSTVRRWFISPSHPRLRHAQMASTVVALALGIAYMASTVFVKRPESGYLALWDGWAYYTGWTAMALTLGLRAIAEPVHRLSWGLFAVGQVTMTVASGLYTFYEARLDPIPYPAQSDAIYLAGYIIWALAIGAFVRPLRHQKIERSLYLDGLITGLAVGAVVAAVALQPILDAASGTPAAVFVGLAYPLLDIVMLVLLVAGMAPVRYRPGPTQLVLGVGLVIYLSADLVYLNQLAMNTFVSGSPVEGAWTLASAFIMIAACTPNSQRDVKWGATDASAVPVVAAFASLGVLTIGSLTTIPPLAVYQSLAVLVLVVVRALMTVREIRRLSDSHRLARTDELTELSNRRAFLEALTDRLSVEDSAGAVAIIDLDGFKEINDTLGHHAGDELLRLLSRRIDRAVPTNAVVARLGGDEFGLLIDGCDHVVETVESFVDAVLSTPFSIDGLTIRIGASVGVATIADHGRSSSELLRCADVAMYDIKRRGGGVMLYLAEDDRNSRARLAMVEELRTAIDQRRLTLHYQPQLDIATRTVVALEALVRWHHPTQGLIAPDAFIGLAERSGLIHRLTRLVIDDAVGYASSLRRKGFDLSMSVNVSASDLLDETLCTYVADALAFSGLDPSALTLEVTEEALVRDPERAARTCLALQQLGVSLAVDDFGIGYSSMSQLLTLSVDELKVDRSFVARLPDDARGLAIVSGAVQLAASLGMRVVVEGVENPAVLDAVADVGAELAQGYGIARPMAVDALEAYLSTASVRRFVVNNSIDASLAHSPHQ